MSLFEVGRFCVKIAGRDAGRTCVVVEQLDSQFVIVDGDVRRKRVNVKHLEPLSDIVELPARASADTVKKVFESKGLPVWRHTAKKTGEKPKQVRAGKSATSANSQNTAKTDQKVAKSTEKVSSKKPISEKPKVVKKTVKKE